MRVKKHGLPVKRRYRSFLIIFSEDEKGIRFKPIYLYGDHPRFKHELVSLFYILPEKRVVVLYSLTAPLGIVPIH